jgi:hypothetical protein
VIINYTTNINKTNNYLQPQIIEQKKKTKTYADGNTCPALDRHKNVAGLKYLMGCKHFPSWLLLGRQWQHSVHLIRWIQENQQKCEVKLWCPLRFLHNTMFRCLYEGSCLIYVICVCLHVHVVMSNTCFVFPGLLYLKLPVSLDY